jgi:dCMP deaminase
MANQGLVPPRANPREILPRVRQVEWDHYYTQIARDVALRANCTGSSVGAVLVRDNRIISTGFNGTPQGFMNCLDGGCVRCSDRMLDKANRSSEMAYPALGRAHKHFDLCICVHAEANALLSAARAGVRTSDTTLYATHKPCFACLKEATQAGVSRVVYLEVWIHADDQSMLHQYELLAEHLRGSNARNFERLHRQRDLVRGTATQIKKPCLDDLLDKLDLDRKNKLARDKRKRAADAKRAAAATPSGRSAGAT